MNNTYLAHYGTKNMKWGVRRYQYEDKSLTPEGRIHYGVGPERVKADKKMFDSMKKHNTLERKRDDFFNKASEAGDRSEQASKKYIDSENKYNDTEQKLHQAKENGKHFKERKYSKQLEKDKNEMNKAYDEFLKLDKQYSDALDAEYKHGIETDKSYKNLEKQAKKYIDKYGDTAYNALSDLIDYDYDDIPTGYYEDDWRF